MFGFFAIRPAEEVRRREKEEFLAGRRQEAALAKQKRIEMQQVAEDRAAEQRRFEVAYDRQEARTTLGAALTAYQQVRETLHNLEAI